MGVEQPSFEVSGLNAEQILGEKIYNFCLDNIAYLIGEHKRYGGNDEENKNLAKRIIDKNVNEIGKVSYFWGDTDNLSEEVKKDILDFLTNIIRNSI